MARTRGEIPAASEAAMNGLYDDGARYGPDPDGPGQPERQACEEEASGIYDDGARYGPDSGRAQR
jgi:hypothetical protein